MPCRLVHIACVDCYQAEQWKKEKLEVYYCGEGYNAYTDYRYKGCGTC